MRLPSEPVPRSDDAENDDLGRKTRHLVPNRVDVGYRYNAFGQLKEIVNGDPNDTQAPMLREFLYEALGRINTAISHNPASGVSGSKVTTSRTYDDAARVVTESTQVGTASAKTLRTTWSLGSKWSREVELSGGGTQRHDLDLEGREFRQTRGSTQRTDFAWSSDLLVQTRSSTSGHDFIRDVSFDAFAQPVGWSFHENKPLLSVSVVRDIAGRVSTSRIEPSQRFDASWRGFTYDAMGRLTGLYEGTPSDPDEPDANLVTEDLNDKVQQRARELNR